MLRRAASRYILHNPAKNGASGAGSLLATKTPARPYSTEENREETNVSNQSRLTEQAVPSRVLRQGFRQRLPLLHTQWDKPEKKLNRAPNKRQQKQQGYTNREVGYDSFVDFSEISELDKQPHQKLNSSGEMPPTRLPRRNQQGGRARQSNERNPRPKRERNSTELSSTTAQPLLGNKNASTAAPSTAPIRKSLRRKRNNLLEEANEEDEASGLALDTNVDLEKEEFWDVDADDMRMLRRLDVWRNPVTAEHPDDPALFKTIKTGYDLYAEDRTQFRLNDKSATWESSSPSMSAGHNAVGGAPGDYTSLLPSEAKRLAGLDSSTLSPLDSVRLTLSSATDMNPRQRENVVAAVQGILSRSQGGQKRQGA